uniref:Aspartic peptidase N-terminal domain-containing protein n=1 Tax=Chelonoidis abingdonii TaxID=106734 RepID=A0A8C0GWG5_CHEAB
IRVPLKKGKSLRQNLKEHGLLEDFLKKNPYNPASKYIPRLANEAATESLTNYMDPSPPHQSFPLLCQQLISPPPKNPSPRQ